MAFVTVSIDEGVATLRLKRGKVNALDGAVVDELRAALQATEDDAKIGAVILTGEGSFFSFGFDIPAFLSFSKDSFAEYLTRFTELYTRIFTLPKPVVAALNGHAIAGGCMLALACDRRIMVEGKAKISLNEISFGSTVFAGSTEMLRFCVGDRHASDVLYSGTMYSGEAAAAIGLVDEVTTPGELMTRASAIARELAAKQQPAFASIKSLLRSRVAGEMKLAERESIREFVEVWYSEETREKLKAIEIR